MVLENQKKFPEDQLSVEIYFAALGDQATNWALEVAQQLRTSGWRIEVEMLQRSLKAQMREANRLKAKYVVMAGDEEIQLQKAIVKNMGTSEQTSIPFGEVIPYFQKSLPR
jgi:histidyl-tRNA synthetase